MINLDAYRLESGKPLMQHQKRGIELARRMPRYGYWHDCGLGKTIMALGIILDRPIKTVVVCPKAIIDAAWLSDARHFPALRVVSGRNSNGRGQDHGCRVRIADDGWGVLVINPELFKKYTADLIRAGVKRLIVDESSMLKNPKAQITQSLIGGYDRRTRQTIAGFADQMSEVYLLSGTPAPNGEHEYWAQLKALGVVVNRNQYAFLNYFMAPQKRFIGGRGEVTVGWKMIEAKRPEFEALLAKCSWSLRKEDAVDLPEKLDVYREVELSGEEYKAYASMRDELSAEWDGETVDAAVQARLMKLRQLSGGFILNDDHKVVEIGTSKLDALVECLEEIGPKPVVIWAEFTADIDRIVKAICGRNFECGVAKIDGRTSDEQRRHAMQEFGKSIRYLVCHPKAVGHGITLVQASYAIYYSWSFSYELYAQSRDRIHRVGQREKCTYIHLLAKGTCDRQILDAVQRKAMTAEIMRAVLGQRVEAVTV